MPRRVPSPAQKKTSQATAATLALSSLHIELENLEKEHQSLLKQIKRKRTELSNFVEQMRSVATKIFHQASPIVKKMSDIDQEIHQLFQEILSNRKLGKQTRRGIESVYRNLQSAGIVSPKGEFDEDDDEELDEMFAEREHEKFDQEFDDEFREQFRQFREKMGQSPEVEGESAPRSSESKQIRSYFLRLAEIFHPDKVTDAETQMRHTEIMKEINRAYQEGDLAKLLEIEKQHEAGELIDSNSEDDLSRACKRLKVQNQLLKKQYEELKRELRLVKNTPEGAMVADYRKATKQGIDVVQMMLGQIEQQVNIIAEIRDFVKDFHDKKITVKQFLAGPRVLQSMQEEMMEELLEQMLEELGGRIVF
ncbi:J domain-containing protein [Calothrix sp. NIES-3974]|uniref:J domain-containing protein n=1 Tax=Calothrix sp. NIES-3974 TaxID=2005462 RepID=UPI000B60C7FF|nr:J domain-containing protein [Calothrix sp. NIES-3974]BAZ03890.1 heat shock protein DnaJ-like protein [Calothrix sp. NIES-3974]